MNSKNIQRALILHLATPDRILLPNAYFAGGEMDLLSITRHGYLSEFEIKISLQDWKADMRKQKWKSLQRKYVSYFWYATPKELWDKNKERLQEVLPHIKEDYGIITFEPVWQDGRGWWLSMCTQRQAQQLPRTEKLTAELLDKIIRKGYHRYMSGVEEDAKANVYYGDLNG